MLLRCLENVLRNTAGLSSLLPAAHPAPLLLLLTECPAGTCGSSTASNRFLASNRHSITRCPPCPCPFICPLRVSCWDLWIKYGLNWMSSTTEIISGWIEDIEAQTGMPIDQVGAMRGETVGRLCPGTWSRLLLGPGAALEKTLGWQGVQKPQCSPLCLPSTF